MVSAPTDAIGLLFLFWGMGFIIKIYTTKKELTASWFVLVSFLLFLPVFFRFMYLPVCIMLPITLTAVGYLNRNKVLIRRGTILTSLTVLLTVVFIILLKLYTGFVLPQYPIERGFFPINAMRWYPFIPASFINIDFAAQRIAQFTAFNYSQAMVIFEIFNVGAIMLLLLFAVLYFKRIRSILLSSTSGFTFFLICGTIVGTIITATLVYSSITYSKEIAPSIFWTFVYEERHWGFFYLFLQLAFFGIFYFNQIKKTFFSRIIIFLIVVALTIECLHGIYYNVKAVLNFKEMKTLQNKDSDWRFFINYSFDLKKANPATDILVASPFRHFQNIAALTGCKGLFDFSVNIQSDIKVAKKTILIMILPADEKKLIEKYLTGNPGKLITVLQGNAFYYHEISP
jgi:hypothetical protein